MLLTSLTISPLAVEFQWEVLQNFYLCRHKSYGFGPIAKRILTLHFGDISASFTEMIGFTNVAIGTDIIDIERLQTAVKRFGGAFLAKVFSKMELEYCTNVKKINYCSLSARFAAKEAFSKALGIGIGIGSALKWYDVAVQNQANGAPTMALPPKVIDIMGQRGFKTVRVSLSHTKTLAQAVVVLIG
jgi:holo-[acyl-carrier protein] synthase